jgi:hypothetical protein
LTEQGIQNENRSRNQQIADVNKSIGQMQKSLDVLRNNKNNFLILAPKLADCLLLIFLGRKSYFWTKHRKNRFDGRLQIGWQK